MHENQVLKQGNERDLLVTSIFISEGRFLRFAGWCVRVVSRNTFPPSVKPWVIKCLSPSQRLPRGLPRGIYKRAGKDVRVGRIHRAFHISFFPIPPRSVLKARLRILKEAFAEETGEKFKWSNLYVLLVAFQSRRMQCKSQKARWNRFKSARCTHK